MDAKDFREISESITNRETLERVYNEILVPAIKLQAERKQKILGITDDRLPGTASVYTSENRKALGFNKPLQRIVEEDMRPLLEEKGFVVVTFTPSYLVEIRW